MRVRGLLLQGCRRRSFCSFDDRICPCVDEFATVSGCCTSHFAIQVPWRIFPDLARHQVSLSSTFLRPNQSRCGWWEEQPRSTLVVQLDGGGLVSGSVHLDPS